VPLVELIWGLLHTIIPVYFWGEDPILAASFCVVTRYVYSLNLTWLVNSWSHLYGYRPYNGKIMPVEATIRHLLIGEGFHNFHHTYPWDYSASELGPLDVFNPATALINFFHYMGWAWDLRKANPATVEKQMNSSGDSLYNRYPKGRTYYEWIGGLMCIFLPLMLFCYWRSLFVEQKS